MKTFNQIREEYASYVQQKDVSEGYESSRIKKNAMPGLTHGTGEKHNGHDGMASYHASMAGKYKGTEAGKHHQRASDHHTRALKALRKGNLNGGLTHAKNALDAAKAAHDSHNSRHSEAGKSDSMSLYHDHKGAANSVKQAKRRDDEYNQRSKPTRSDKPIQRAIGKTKSKIKKVLRMGEEVEQVDEISDKMLARYKKKAFKQYNVSAKRKDDPGYTPAKRAQHADRYRKRSKGIGGYFQRDMAKKDRTMTLPSGKKVKMSTGSKYMHKSHQDDMYRKGKKGMTMTGRPASAMPKSYQNPDRK